MKRSTCAILLIFLCSSIAFGEQLNAIAPTEIPGTRLDMKTSGFWVSRHPDPDKIVLNAQEITRLNDQIREEIENVQDLTRLDKSAGRDLRNSLTQKLNEISKKGYYLKNGQLSGAAFFENVRENMNLSGIAERIEPKYGVVVGFADHRFLPTEKILTAEPGDIDFDELQNSDLDLGTPVVILHDSKDQEWLYVIAYESSGWVKKDNIALCSIKELKKFLSPDSFVVVTSAKADIFMDSKLIRHHSYVRMGTRLPLTRENSETFSISLPKRDAKGRLRIASGYLKAEDAHKGYLSYTPRTTIEQAFKLLNAPYGWGGMHNEQDCSRFLMEVFSTVGIHLPRDSKDQGKAGRLLAEFASGTEDEKKIELLKDKGVGGITILRMKGHIMLFLGIVDDQPCAIHATWGYREKRNGKDVVRVLNRVVVSDLSLGEGSTDGSLLRRLSTVRVLDQ